MARLPMPLLIFTLIFAVITAIIEAFKNPSNVEMGFCLSGIVLCGFAIGIVDWLNNEIKILDQKINNLEKLTDILQRAKKEDMSLKEFISACEDAGVDVPQEILSLVEVTNGD